MVVPQTMVQLAPSVAPVFNEGGSHLVHLADFRPGVVDVGEDHGRAAEDAVFQGHSFVDGDVVLDFAVFADGDIRADHHVLADVAVFADSGIAEDVGEVPDFAFRSRWYTFVIYNGGFGCWKKSGED